jgi:hypothetical protein
MEGQSTAARPPTHRNSPVVASFIGQSLCDCGLISVMSRISRECLDNSRYDFLFVRPQSPGAVTRTDCWLIPKLGRFLLNLTLHRSIQLSFSPQPSRLDPPNSDLSL